MRRLISFLLVAATGGPLACARLRNREAWESGTPSVSRPLFGVVEVIQLEDADLAWDHPSEGFDHVLHPVLVADNGDLLPVSGILETELGVLPHRPRRQALELLAEDVFGESFQHLEHHSSLSVANPTAAIRGQGRLQDLIASR